MKKSFLFSLVISAFCFTANAQTNVYHPFPDSNAVWNEYTGTNSGYGYYIESIIGDTIINSIKYHKVYKHTESLTPSDTIITISNSWFIGAIREDSLKRIYFYNKYAVPCCGKTDSTYLLYDFSKHVGDTVFFSNNFQYGYTYPYLIVNSIDSILAYNQYRKRFNLNGETWIEGIGSTRSLFSAILGIPTCFCTNELVCYKYRDTSYYLNP